MLRPLDWPRIRAARAWRREVYDVGDIVNWLSLFRTSIKIFKKSRMQLLSCWRVGWKGQNLLDSIFSANELFVEWGINWIGQSSVGIKLCTHVRLWNCETQDGEIKASNTFTHLTRDGRREWNRWQQHTDTAPGLVTWPSDKSFPDIHCQGSASDQRRQAEHFIQGGCVGVDGNHSASC